MDQSSPGSKPECPGEPASQDLDANRPLCEPGSPPPSPTPPITYAFANEFHHRDHLGSLRLVTDAAGAPDEAYDYYPYGRQMVPDGGDEIGMTRARYTGHERDGYVGQDYMFARYKAANEVAFLNPDRYVNSAGGITPTPSGAFTIAESAIYPGDTNYIRIRRSGEEAGRYSAAASVVVDPTLTTVSPNQIRVISVARSGTNLIVRWSLLEENNKKTKLYFTRGDTGESYPLTLLPLSAGIREYTISSQALAAPCGSISATQVDNGGGESGPSLGAGMPSAVALQAASESPGQSCGPAPASPPAGTYSFANSFQHRDHLGSLRVVTDALGHREGAYDYYPYGRQMVPYGTSEEGVARRRYTGHERDGYVGKDQMFFREKLTNDTSFLTPDPGSDVSAVEPISWNRYTYVRGSPLASIDPLGLREVTVTKQSPDQFDGSGGGTCYGWTVTETYSDGSVKTYFIIDYCVQSKVIGAPTGDPVIKRYTAESDCVIRAAELQAAVSADFSSFANSLSTDSFGGLFTTNLQFKSGPVQAGSYLPITLDVINNPSVSMPLPQFPYTLETSVAVTRVADDSLVFRSIPGHPIYPGRIEFGAQDLANGRVRFSIGIEGTLDGMFNSAAFSLGGSAFEDSIWRNFLDRVADRCGGEGAKR